MRCPATWSLLLLCGCTVTAIKPTEADRNRERVQALEKENAALVLRNLELEAALGAAQRQALPGAATIDPATMASAPFAATLRIGRFSGIVDDSEDGRPDLVRLYLEPRDGRDLVIQVAARATVRVVQRAPDGGDVKIGSAVLDSTEWRAAFRSGLMGSFYAVDVPLSGSIDPTSPVDVRVALDDAFTGRRLEASTTFRFEATTEASR